MRGSLLKFEPKVSNFPVLEANGMASSTFATAVSLWIMSFIYESTFLNMTSLNVVDDASSLVNTSLIDSYCGKSMCLDIL